MDRIHETGLLGSMRWWYEALVRGLGGKVCESGGECEFNADKYKKSVAGDEGERLRESGLCDVCQVFGSTGWKRRFRLSIAEKNVENAIIQHRIKAEEKTYEAQGKKCTPIRYFQNPLQADIKPTPPNTPQTGSFEIQVQNLCHDFPPDVIRGLIQFIADWGVLGARAQMGFGIIEPMNGRFDTRPLYQWLVATAGSRQYTELPSLNNIFLARIKLKNAREVDTFNLKYDLRRLFSADRDLRHFIMGTTAKGEERTAAKVKISRPYGEGVMRVWGWIPEEADRYNCSWDRNRIVEIIHAHLTTSYNVQFWREMGSLRDTVAPNTVDATKFLQSLLGIEEG